VQLAERAAGQYGTCVFLPGCAHSAPPPPNAVHGMICITSDPPPRWYSVTESLTAMCWSAGPASVPKGQQARVHALPAQQACMFYPYAGRGSRCCRSGRGAGHVVCPRAARFWTGTGNVAHLCMTCPPARLAAQDLHNSNRAWHVQSSRPCTHTRHTPATAPLCLAGDPGPHRRADQGVPLLQSSTGRVAG
jgi:hypothetical protein